MEKKRLFWLAVIVLCVLALVFVTLTHEAAGEVWIKLITYLLIFTGAGWVWSKFRKKEKEGN